MIIIIIIIMIAQNKLLSLVLTAVQTNISESPGESLQRNGCRAKVRWQTVPHKRASDHKVMCEGHNFGFGTKRHRLSAYQRCRLPAMVVTNMQLSAVKFMQHHDLHVLLHCELSAARQRTVAVIQLATDERLHERLYGFFV